MVKKNIIYGGMAADVFNFMFDAPDQMQYLYAVTHGFTPLGLDTVLPVLDAAKTPLEKAVAFGFVTHNNVNGADLTAHGLPYNDPSGYVIAKALKLNGKLKPLLAKSGISIPDAVLLEVSHTFVEYAADLLIRKADRSVGASMNLAVITRDKAFPELLVTAYADGFAGAFGITKGKASSIIRKEEANFRKLMVYYGTILQYDDQMAFDETANFLAELAPAFLESYGVKIPPEALLSITRFGMWTAMILCKHDLLPKVQETIELVQRNLGHYRDGSF
jgi:hypothetical protein